MRGLQFRVWDIYEKKYLQDVGISMQTKTGILKFLHHTNLFNSGSTTILEQRTGLVDKNGKEIYEGDILEFDGGKVMEVRFMNGCFFIGDEACVFFSLELNSRVVGNIHENPELLK